MSRTRIVKGTYTKISAKGHSMYSSESIITTASNFVTEEGIEKGLSIGLPKSAPKLEYTDEPDFDIELELIEKDFVPLGIPDYKGSPENDKIQFELTVTGAGINQWHLTIKNGKDILYESFSASGELEEVIITAKSKNPKAKSNNPKVTTPVVIKRYWPAGKYILSWTGFNKNGIYDSTILKSEKGLTVSIVGQAEFKKKTFTIDQPIKFTHKEVDWVDVRIDKINKKIDTTLRVNLKDGGTEGLSSWDKISKEALSFYNKPPIKIQERTYANLEKLALQGINQFWSRNSSNVGKGVSIASDKYEVFIHSKADNNGLSAPSIIYQTNIEAGRSRNFEASRKLFFYEGYLYRDSWKKSNPSSVFYKNKGWIYRSENINEEKNVLLNLPSLVEDFKMVSAHEIGHEILLAYGGQIYSKGHNGTTTWINLITQDVNDDAPYIPTDGEIDLMKYYQDYYDISRTIITEFDLLKLIWLSKIKIL